MGIKIMIFIKNRHFDLNFNFQLSLNLKRTGLKKLNKFYMNKENVKFTESGLLRKRKAKYRK